MFKQILLGGTALMVWQRDDVPVQAGSVRAQRMPMSVTLGGELPRNVGICRFRDVSRRSWAWLRP